MSDSQSSMLLGISCTHHCSHLWMLKRNLGFARRIFRIFNRKKSILVRWLNSKTRTWSHWKQPSFFKAYSMPSRTTIDVQRCWFRQHDRHHVPVRKIGHLLDLVDFFVGCAVFVVRHVWDYFTWKWIVVWIVETSSIAFSSLLFVYHEREFVWFGMEC